MNRHQPRKQAEERCCICLECNTRVPYRDYVTCLEVNCPKCGAVMVREGSLYHQYVLEHGRAPIGRSHPRRQFWKRGRREVRESYG